MRCAGSAAGNDTVRVVLNDDQMPLLVLRDAEPAEAMRYLPAGQHRLRLQADGTASVGHLVVRAIPELLYGTYPSDPMVREFGPYSWQFLQRHVLHSVTTITGLPSDDQRLEVDLWKESGRKWIAEHSAGWYDYTHNRASETADDFFNVVTRKPGMSHPMVDGVLLDTHDVGHNNRYHAYAEAVRRIRGSREFGGKDLYFYCDTLFGAPMSEQFARTVLDTGCRLVWTAYLHEQATEVEAISFLESVLVAGARGWEKNFNGSLRQTVMGLGYLTSPGERMNVNPSTNYLVLMDLQCRILANHPAFKNLAGVMWYKAPYANDEPLRWAGKLFRHYFIEGNTDLLSSDPYELNHLQNPDFDQGTSGWTLTAAEPDSIEARHLDRYGFAQGRWLETGMGDQYLLMRRSDKQPNQFSQTIRHLEAGRLYTLKLYTADLDRLLDHATQERKHAISIALRGAEQIQDKSFQHVYPPWSYYHLGPYDDQETEYRNYMNFHYSVFRAKGTTAQIEVSDWLNPDGPGGPIGQRLMYNFVEVQPYLEP